MGGGIACLSSDEEFELLRIKTEFEKAHAVFPRMLSYPSEYQKHIYLASTSANASYITTPSPLPTLLPSIPIHSQLQLALLPPPTAAFHDRTNKPFLTHQISLSFSFFKTNALPNPCEIHKQDSMALTRLSPSISRMEGRGGNGRGAVS